MGRRSGGRRIGSRKARTIGLAALVAAVAAAGIAVAAAFALRPTEAADPVLRLSYTIKPAADGQSAIEVSVVAEGLPAGRALELYPDEVRYADASGLAAKDGRLWTLASDDGGEVRFRYTALLGRLEKHGHRGGVYDDLIAFDGGEALLLPQIAFATADGGEDGAKLGEVSVHYDVDPGWRTAVPCAVADESRPGAVATRLESPQWADIYELRKSSYALGKLKAVDGSPTGEWAVYADAASEGEWTEAERAGFRSLYDYYRSLFGEGPPQLSFIALRGDGGDGRPLIGGSGREQIASSFDGRSARDWELLSHRMFHAFFDTAVRLPNFHEAPQLWFYEGLATYYENASMDSLPASLREPLGLSAADRFLTLYKQYLYMYFKDRSLLELTPMDEAKYEGNEGVIEFLHYTQAPLVVKAIEDLAESRGGGRDRVLHYLLQRRSDAGLGLQDAVNAALGDDAAAFAGRYLLSDQLLPLGYMPVPAEEDADRTLAELSEIEYTEWTWFSRLDPDYPQDPLETQGMLAIAAAAAERNVHYASSEAEALVRKMSPAVHALLAQYALRAEIGGVELTDPMARYLLLGDERRVAEWKSFVQGLGEK